ncbi:MAG: UDP-3-O-(3-hydroxymyristoyl)glucosamine N-acyltransferase [Flavobacteriales bacterium]|nr:UDP-3-O-(3-hydroxymyristoyl)glucosamine N-acyltransferase [Flavobacteriales bacterium]
MEVTAKVLAERIGGSIEGSSDVVLNQIAKIDEAEEGSLTFLANMEYEGFIYTTQASAALVAENFNPSHALPEHLTLIRVADPYAAFAAALRWAAASQAYPEGISPNADVDTSAEVGANCYIGPFTVVEAGAKIEAGCQIHSHVSIGRGVRIGAGTILHRQVSVLDHCTIGSECIIQAGAVIGSDGFGFAPNSAGHYDKVPQTGNVSIGNRCEIGAATTIDRATLGSTVIEDGVKLDNQIQIAHNVKIGSNTVIAAQTGVAGSTTIGADCMVGGQVGFAGHITVADGVKIAAQSGITKSISEPNGIWQGTPAQPIKAYQSQQIALRKLIRALVLDRIEALEQKLS